MPKKPYVFDEWALRLEIIRIWGECGAHCEVYDMLLRKADCATYDSKGLPPALDDVWAKTGAR